MKKSYILMIVAMFCMFATGCNKDAKTIGRFIVSEQGFVDPDSKMHFTWLEGASSHLSYDNNDALKINGYNFTLHKSGTQWYAEEQNHEDVTASNFYSIYADPNMTITGSGPNYGFSFGFTGQIANTNGIILAGSTEDSMLTLKPACAIISFPAGQRMDYVRVGFSNEAIPSSGTLNVSSGTPSITATGYIPGVTSESAGGFLEMINDGHDAYATYYVAVPVKNGAVSTQLFLTWKEYGSATVYKYKTTGNVTLQQGKVYTVGKTRVSAFDLNGASNSYFVVGYNEDDEEFTVINFSAGNLQYRPSSSSWRFAENQYSAIGEDNKNISSMCTDYIDLFGWGTSNYNPSVSGVTFYHPYNSGEGTDGAGVINNTKYIRSASIAGTQSDWGVHNSGSIYYAGNASAANWRTLTSAEWTYLLSGRTNAASKWGLATVNDMYKGIVFIPDGMNNGDPYSQPAGVSFTPGSGSGFNTNSYSIEDWTKMELAGAIFIPAAGIRSAKTVNGFNSQLHYWTATANGVNDESNASPNAYEFKVQSGVGSWVVNVAGNTTRSKGCAVRLVKNR